VALARIQSSEPLNYPEDSLRTSPQHADHRLAFKARFGECHVEGEFYVFVERHAWSIAKEHVSLFERAVTANPFGRKIDLHLVPLRIDYPCRLNVPIHIELPERWGDGESQPMFVDDVQLVQAP